MASTIERTRDATAHGKRETSIWDVYNHAADLRDSELIKDWNNSLHFLLIFAAVFASILTGFVIESMKPLQVNSRVEVKQIRHMRAAAGLLFASLCLSLVAALAAVTALQWVNEYNAGLSTVDARKRALVRHARFTGTERRVMGGIIPGLSLLLHASVFLFFAGMTIWMWTSQRDTTLFGIGLGSTAIALTLYVFGVVSAADYASGTLRRRGSRALRLLILSPALVISFLVSYLYGRLVGWPELLQALTDPIWRLIGGASSEHTTIECPALESQLIKWTASNVDIAHLLHIIDQAYPSLVTNKPLSGTWYRIGNRVTKLLLRDTTAREFFHNDSNAIRIMVNFWTAVRSRYSEYWSWKAVCEDSWADWKPVLKLIGPLEFHGVLTQRELTIVTMLIEISIVGEGEQSCQKLGEVAAALLSSTKPITPYIFRYAISSLSTYAWTRTRTQLYDRIVDLLTRLLTLPAGEFHSPLLSSLERSLVLSALYSVAFGANDGPRRYWSLRHPFLNPTQLRDNLKTVQSLHLAITNHYAAAALQLASEFQTRKYLRYFSCLLAYTPVHQFDGGHFFQRAKRILAEGDPSIPTEDRTTPAALSSLIWMSNMGSITSVNEYLEVFLSCRKRFPSLKPVWRDWLTEAELEKYADIEADDRAWLVTLQQDRRLTELLSAFDQLIHNGCSVKRHLVIVRIVIDDLSDDTGSEYDGYYTGRRIRQLEKLHDPALRLIAARGASIPYTGKVPSRGDSLWRSAPWLEAMSFWCRGYQNCDIAVDDCLLRGAVIHGSTKLFSVVRETASINPPLAERLYHILHAEWNSQYDAGEVLLLHASTLRSPSFTEYFSTGSVVAKLLDIIPAPRSLDIRVLPLLSSFVGSIDSLNHFQVISTRILTAQVDTHERPCQSDVEEICTPFETILRENPSWLVSTTAADGDDGPLLSEQINKIISFFRGPENKARAVTRWTARNRSPSGVDSEMGIKTYRYGGIANGTVQKEQLSSRDAAVIGGVTPEYQPETATLVDHAHLYGVFEASNHIYTECVALEDHLFSCSACWDI